MPVTRSASRIVQNDDTTPSKNPRALKSPSVSKKKFRPTPSLPKNIPVQTTTVASTSVPSYDEDKQPALVPAVLTFSFEDAKRHLINADRRFEDIFRKMRCKPFEQLEQVHPFCALTTSILGQQISWLAAKAIHHKFIRLYNPSLPEKAADYDAETKSQTPFFPTPHQVAATDLPTLRTAGLSGRKAEYVQDLAARFADGRLSTEKLVAANDEELASMLIEVRGIGRWTVDMFAIFSLRRPNILPVGDLGIQRGLIRWFLSLHSPSHSFSLSPEKVTTESGVEFKDDDPSDVLPVFGAQASGSQLEPGSDSGTAQDTQSLSSIPVASISSTPPRKGQTYTNFDLSFGEPMPTPFTPSMNKTLDEGWKGGGPVAPLPGDLSVAILKTRLEGKKKIKGALLTPQEMEDLTESWKPYRSLGAYYMWSLAPPEK